MKKILSFLRTKVKSIILSYTVYSITLGLCAWSFKTIIRAMDWRKLWWFPWFFFRKKFSQTFLKER